MPKGNEDLKAKIAKIQQKGKAPAVPEVQEEMPEETEEPSMEALEAEFEAKKQALIQKTKKASPAVKPQQDETEGEADEDGLHQAIAEYSDEGKFRVELVFQLVQVNKSLKEIADALKKFANNGEE